MRCLGVRNFAERGGSGDEGGAELVGERSEWPKMAEDRLIQC